MISSGATGYDSKLWEHTKYFYDVQAWVPKNMIFVNTDSWDGLEDGQPQAIEQAAAEAEDPGWDRHRELSQRNKEQLAANGTGGAAPHAQLKADFHDEDEPQNQERHNTAR